jgi:GDP-L-fucose synthase
VANLPAQRYWTPATERLSHLNVGSGAEVSIAGLAAAVAEVVGYTGRIVQDPSKPDGTPRKLLDSSALAALGWRASITLREGLAETYKWFLANVDQVRQA